MKYLAAYRLKNGNKHLAEITEVSSHEEALAEVRKLLPEVVSVVVLVAPLA